ncbi:hypothetical protein Tco_0323982 [Tanacetum coccineum]
MNEILLDKVKEDIWKWFYCIPKCSLEQVILVDYYFKNLIVVESHEEATSIYKSHKKAKKDVDSMSVEELIAWEQEEAQSPSYLSSPHVTQRTSIHGKGKVLLDYFEVVGSDLCSKDGLISTTGDGDPTVSKNSYCGSSSSNLH